MTASRQRRRKKHRGTQAGTVRRRARTSRPTSRGEARASARQRRLNRLDRPPSWRSAANRAALAAAVFFAVLVLVLGQSVTPSISIALVMFLVYIPLGYAMDSFLYRLRQRRKDRGEETRPEG
jgi:Flp pilus assembly protein TadB